jgi:hypothetical protein
MSIWKMPRMNVASWAVHQWKSEGQIEPPIMERLSAWGYRLAGTDDLRIPRFLAIFFWTAGGIGLFLLLRDVVGAKGGVIGLAYYMVLPFPLYASRSFQPEPLMTAAIIFSWWAIVRWAQKKTWIQCRCSGFDRWLCDLCEIAGRLFCRPCNDGCCLDRPKAA